MMLSLALVAVVSQAPFADELREWRTDFSRHTVPLAEIVSGGPPKDGIPAIDRPRFETVAEAAAWLDDREPVVVVEIAADARAYPLQILIWHEIVNDDVGGTPVAVTYCPLCNTALAFDRRQGGRVLDFGTTGRLRHSDLVMYDRQTESWWQQATGEGIVGAYAGRRLRFIAAPIAPWRDFRESYPAGRVLSRETGYERPYGRNPYEHYDTRRGPIAGFFDAALDKRLPAMERVVAIDLTDGTAAYAFSLLARRRVINDEIGGLAVVVVWAPGTVSALDAPAIRDGRDVGATAVFDRRLDGRALTFELAGDGRFRDRETGSVWHLSGRAVEGPLAGRRLVPVPHGNHFWFAWAAFRPDARLVK
ncbi:MAG: DUF3179 domain-containing protein [Gemmatimonadales bacterium]